MNPYMPIDKQHADEIPPEVDEPITKKAVLQKFTLEDLKNPVIRESIKKQLEEIDNDDKSTDPNHDRLLSESTDR